LNVGSAVDNLQRQINIIDNLSLVHGSHSFKFGVDFRRLMPLIAPRSYAQTHSFSGVTGALTGRSALTMISAEFTSREPIYDNLSLFGQDTWKISRRLNLTYGLRWELNTAPHEKNGNEPRTVTGFDNPSTVVLAPPGTPL